LNLISDIRYTTRCIEKEKLDSIQPEFINIQQSIFNKSVIMITHHR